MSGVSIGKIGWMSWDCQKSGAKFMRLLPRKTGDMVRVEDAFDMAESQRVARFARNLLNHFFE